MDGPIGLRASQVEKARQEVFILSMNGSVPIQVLCFLSQSKVVLQLLLQSWIHDSFWKDPHTQKSKPFYVTRGRVRNQSHFKNEHSKRGKRFFPLTLFHIFPTYQTLLLPLTFRVIFVFFVLQKGFLYFMFPTSFHSHKKCWLVVFHFSFSLCDYDELGVT